MAYLYVVGFILVGVYLMYMAIREYKILIIPGIYFIFLGIWRLADIHTDMPLMQGMYAWILRGISFVVIVATGTIYYMKYRKK